MAGIDYQTEIQRACICYVDKDGNKVYEVNTPINDVLNRVQQFVIDEYLELVQPKKWAFKKEGNDE